MVILKLPYSTRSALLAIQNYQLLILKARGVKGLIAFNKAVRLNLLNFLSGNPSRVPGAKLAIGGIPKILGPFVIQLYNGTIPKLSLQLVLTLLFITRGLELKAKPNIDTITKPLKEGSQLGIGEFMPEFWRSLGFNPCHSLPRSLKFTQFHFTNKVGPSGHALFQ